MYHLNAFSANAIRQLLKLQVAFLVINCCNSLAKESRPCETFFVQSFNQILCGKAITICGEAAFIVRLQEPVCTDARFDKCYLFVEWFGDAKG